THDVVATIEPDIFRFGQQTRLQFTRGQKADAFGGMGVLE
ncbi:MAG: hypothetical protein RLY60_1456, partial [Pseudomonadota bacterium]